MTNWLQLQQVLEKTSPKSHKKAPREHFKRPYKKRRLTQTEADMLAVSQKKNIFTEDENNADKKSSSYSYSKAVQSSSSNDQNTNPEDSLKEITKVVAMDCEMVGVGPEGKESALARVSIVNSHGHCIYDEFVKPKEKVTDFRTEISGIRPSNLKKGKDLFEVQKEVAAIIEGRKVVGHDLSHDFKVLFLSHPKKMIRDTSRYKPFREVCGGKTPSLKKLTLAMLGCDIQSGEHSSVEDAQAAMLIYLRNKKAWERELKGKRRKKQDPAQA